ncbi:MAG: MarR family winged helix-turn-helix transcriptional regulator [Polymorphobacter sp.]
MVKILRTGSDDRNIGAGRVDKAEHLQAIMNAGRQIHEAVDTIDMIIADQLGIHRTDLRCLHLLEMAPRTPGEIAARTRLTSGAVTALLDRLEAAGLVERCRSCADRRSVMIVMPEAQVAAIRSMYSEIGEMIRVHFAGHDAGALAETACSLEQFARALERYGSAHGVEPSMAQANFVAVNTGKA